MAIEGTIRETILWSVNQSKIQTATFNMFSHTAVEMSILCSLTFFLYQTSPKNNISYHTIASGIRKNIALPASLIQRGQRLYLFVFHECACYNKFTLSSSLLCNAQSLKFQNFISREQHAHTHRLECNFCNVRIRSVTKWHFTIRTV